MDASSLYCTFMVVFAVTCPLLVVTVAVMVVDPDESRVAKPLPLMVAMVVVPLVQATRVVRSLVELSAKVPVAVNCSVPWVRKTLGLLGVMAIEVNWVVVTIKLAVSEPESWLAEMVALPAATGVAIPELLMVTTVEGEAVHLAVEDTSLESPLTVVPLAVNCTESPTAARRDLGLTVREAMESPEVKKLLHPPMNATATIIRMMKARA